jgi:hypothetical protein|tara:strand:+ start:536 stop:673 length:138 start_codon:yes stop_codon:yes gene_type:complete
MNGEIDSRASDTKDFTTDVSGANDNASEMEITISGRSKAYLMVLV